MRTAQTSQNELVKRVKRSRVTERDVRILGDLFRIRAAIEMDFTCYFGHQQNLNKRLSVLEQKGYIKREWYKPNKYGDIGRTGKFAIITEQGAQVVIDDMGYAELDLQNVEYRPEAKSLAKFLMAASVYLEQAEQLKQNGWDWEPGYVMRRLYGNDFRYPAIGYLRNIEKGLIVPIFVILNQRTGRGVKGRVGKAIDTITQLLSQGVNLGRYTIATNVLLVSDELYEVALERMRDFAISPFKLIPIGDASNYLSYAIENTSLNIIKHTDPSENGYFDKLIETNQGDMYYVNLMKYNPVEFWKVIGYDRQKAEEDARYKERERRYVCVVVSDMQAELIRKHAPDRSMMVLLDQSFNVIRDKTEG